MKPIEERAIRASDGYDDDGYQAGLYMGYMVGAYDQKQIDIDKACEWLKARNVLTNASLYGFRQAMEE